MKLPKYLQQVRTFLGTLKDDEFYQITGQQREKVEAEAPTNLQ
jgi:hypothetical protein